MILLIHQTVMCNNIHRETPTFVVFKKSWHVLQCYNSLYFMRKNVIIFEILKFTIDVYVI